MNVRLISYSQPSSEMTDVGIKNVQDLISFCARVSNPGNQLNTETSENLIRFLIKHQHWSPLELTSACLEVETTRDIARQILRHRSFSFSEYSQRYADPTKDLHFEVRDARLQDTKNRQNSIDVTDDVLKRQWKDRQEILLEQVKKQYEWAIENGIAKEQARAVLPEGITVSKLYINGTLRSWVHYIQLRTDKSTQKEHREVAVACANAIEPIFPMIKEFVNV